MVVASGDDFPDALAATFAADLTTSPVLLTAQDDLTDATREALALLAPEQIILVGGPAAVDPAVEDELATTAPVTRVAGDGRAATAAAVAALGDADGDGALDDGGTTAIVASGAGFADALAAGPVAYAAHHPLLLTHPDELSAETAAALADLGISAVLVAGGPAAVSNKVVGQLASLGLTVSRIAGESRVTTALAFAEYAEAELGFTPDHANLATGGSFADALALAAHAGADVAGPSPVLLADGDALGEANAAFLAARATCGVLSLHVAGGDAALPADIVTAAQEAATRPEPCTDSERLLAVTDAAGAHEHQGALQAIADANNGTRASGTPGYDASVDYVVAQLEGAGYEVTVQDFEFLLFQELSPTEVTIGGEPLTEDQASIMEYSGTGDVTGTVALVDADLGPSNPGTGEANDGGSDSGCEPEDFAGFPAGAIALVQRGTCDFVAKAQNALDAGAIGVLIFNEGNNDERSTVLLGTLGAVPSDDLPVVGLDFATGLALAEDPTAEVQIVTDTITTLEFTKNVITERPGDPDNVVMAGAHLDSVLEGPGIQDNGSGSSGLLELALQLARLGVAPTNTVRFAWWGAEESGLFGSEAYIFGDGAALEGISDADYAALKLYLNFDMIASPNFARFIYDGDGSALSRGAARGSDPIDASFERFFESAGLPASHRLRGTVGLPGVHRRRYPLRRVLHRRGGAEVRRGGRALRRHGGRGL